MAALWSIIALLFTMPNIYPAIFGDFLVANIAIAPALLLAYGFYKFHPRFSFRIETTKVLISYANHVLTIMYMIVLSKCYTGHHPGQIDDNHGEEDGGDNSFKCSAGYQATHFLNFFYHSIMLLWRLREEYANGFPYLLDLVTCCGRIYFWARCTCPSQPKVHPGN